MSVTTGISLNAGQVDDNLVLQEAISEYSHEAYTNAKKLTGTGIIGETDPNINVDTETYIGQTRWYKPINPTINVASLTDSTDGSLTSYGQDYLNYVKTVRTHGAKKVNLQEVISKEDGLAKIGMDFGETQGQDEHNSVLAILRGVALSEMLQGAGSAGGGTGLGGQSFTNDPTDKKYGFYVDLGAVKPVVDATTTIQGAGRAEGFLSAMGMAWKDYEPDYAYLIVSPQVMMSLRSANLVDTDKVTEGNIKFDTIFQGKFRLLQTRATQGFSAAEVTKVNTGLGVDIVGSMTSFIVLPGSIAMKGLSIPIPVEIERKAAAFKGGGTTSIWYRWGNVYVPAGYNWLGTQDAFPSDAQYGYAIEGSDAPEAITTVTDADLDTVTGTWGRKASSALTLGILPVFHD